MAQRPWKKSSRPSANLGALFSAIFGQAPLEGSPDFNPAYDFQTGNVPFEGVSDPTAFAYPYKNKGVGVIENNRVLAQVAAQNDEINKRAAATQNAIELKAQLDLAEKMRWYGYDPETGEQVPGQPWQRAEELSKYRAAKGIVPGMDLNALGQPSVDEALNKMLEQTALSKNVTQRSTAEQPFINSRVTAENQAAISGADQKDLLAKIGIKAIQQNPDAAFQGAVGELLAPAIKNFIGIPQGGMSLNPISGQAFLGPTARTAEAIVPNEAINKPGISADVRAMITALRPTETLRTVQTTPPVSTNIFGGPPSATILQQPQSQVSTNDIVMAPLKKDLTLPDGTVIKAGTSYPHRRKQTTP